MTHDQIKYLQSEEYKQKYDDLMKRCAEFMEEWNVRPTPYQQGFQDGWEAAKKEFDKDKTYVPDTTKPAQTMDIQWPRDIQPVYPRTTTPWPPEMRCSVCGIGGDINKAMAYVCNNPKCPTRVTCIT